MCSMQKKKFTFEELSELCSQNNYDVKAYTETGGFITECLMTGLSNRGIEDEYVSNISREYVNDYLEQNHKK